MKNWRRLYICILSIILIIIIVTIGIFIKEESIPPEKVKLGCDIVKYVCLFVIVAMIVYYVTYIIAIIKNGVHNVSQCDDELFNEIDQYKRYWSDTKENYLRQIQIINLFYQQSGKLDELVNNKEIDKLYARADFLAKSNSLYEDLITQGAAIMVSLTTFYICQAFDSNRISGTLLGIISLLGFYCLLVLFKHAERGQAGSYLHMVVKYEEGLLTKKINDLEKSIVATQGDETILKNQKIIIDQLIQIRKKTRGKKRKEQVTNDIKCIERLNLCLENYDNCYMQKIIFNSQDCFLLYDEFKGKENNYIGEANLKTKAYSILYVTLKKYGITYHDN